MDEETKEARCFLVDNYGEVFAKKYFKDLYHGVWDSELEFAIDTVEGMCDVNDWLKSYINYERLAEDMFNTDYMSYELDNGSLAIFRR